MTTSTRARLCALAFSVLLTAALPSTAHANYLYKAAIAADCTGVTLTFGACEIDTTDVEIRWTIQLDNPPFSVSGTLKPQLTPDCADNVFTATWAQLAPISIPQGIQPQTGTHVAVTAALWHTANCPPDGCHGFYDQSTTQDAAVECACTGTMGDYVWVDFNGNGIQDDGNTGIPGVTVKLSGAGTATTVTDGTGHYLFTGLCGGDYVVTVDSTTLPPGLVPTLSNAPGSTTSNDSNGSPASVTLPDNGTDLTIDFGYGAPPVLPCPGGSFSFSFDLNGNLNIVFDQFPAPNDNSYGVNAVGWANGHKFSDLVGSDHAGFQLVDGSGVVKLSFNIDYITANLTAPSGYASFGPFGGDGKVVVGTLTPSDLTWSTSLERNLNNVNIPGLFTAQHVQQFGSVNVLVNSPPTDANHTTYNISDPALAGWDFHDTYYVTILASKLQSLGFNANWKVQPNLDALHNSPAKVCPPQPGGQSLSVTKREVKDKQVKITLLNSGSVAEVIEAVLVTWPQVNGKLVQVKLDADVIYDNPDIAPPSANLTLLQLVADAKKRTIDKGTSDVLYLIFEKNADHDLTHYTGTVSSGGTALSILP